MQEGHIVALHEVKARWALSELVSARTSVFYRDSPLEDICSKIAAGSTFESLDATEIERLVHAFKYARGIYLGHYLQNVSQFTLQNWSKAELADVYALSEMTRGIFIPLREYAASPPATDSANTPAQSDPRVVAASMAATHQPVRSKHPVTVGTYKNLRVLIDGYARSLLFLLAAKDGDRIKVFVPVGGQQM